MKFITFIGFILAGCMVTAGNMPAAITPESDHQKPERVTPEQLAQAGVTEDGWQKIQEALRADSFTIGTELSDGDNARGAFNAAHRLDIRFPAEGGMRLGGVVRRAPGSPPTTPEAAPGGGFGTEWWLGLKPTAIRSGSSVRTIESEPEAAVRGSRLEQEYAEGLTEGL